MKGFSRARRWQILPLLVLVAGTVPVIVFFTPLGVTFTRVIVNASGIVHIGSASGSYLKNFSFEDISKKDGSLTIQHVSVSWAPFSLITGTLLIEKVRVKDIRVRLEEERGEKGGTTHFFYSFPGKEVVVEDVQVRNIFIDRGRDAAGVPLPSFQLRAIEACIAVSRKNIAVSTLRVEGPEMALDTSGYVQLGTDKTVDFNGAFRLAGFGFKSMAGSFSFSGPLKAPDVVLELDSPGFIRVKGKFNDFLGLNHWQAQVIMRDMDLSSWIKHCPHIVLDKASAFMSGDFSYYTGEVNVQGRWGRFNQLKLRSSLWGNDEYIDFHTLSLKRDQGTVTADNARISWKKIFDWRADVVVRNVDTSLLHEQLEGTLNASFHSNGEVFEEDVASHFNVQKLHCELHGQPFSLKGEVELHAGWVASDFLEVSSGKFGGKALVGPMRLAWGGERDWSAEVVLQRFNPGFFHEVFQGEVSGAIAARGYLGEDGQKPNGLLFLHSLSGHLRGKKLSGQGELSLADGIFSTKGFAIRLGRSSLRLLEANVGAYGDNDSIFLRGDFYSPALEEVIPGAAGEMKFSARLGGSISRPDINLSFNGRQLVLAEMALDTLAGTLNLKIEDERDKGSVRGQVHFSGARFGQSSIREGAFNLKGRIDKHQLTAQLTDAAVANQHFSLAGAASGTYAPGEMKWSGQVINGLLDLKKTGVWHQQGTAAITLAAHDSRVAGLVLTGEQQGKLFFSGALQKGENNDMLWDMSARMEEISLTQIFSGMQIPIEGEGTGGLLAEFSGKGDNVVEGKLDFFMDTAMLEIGSSSSPLHQVVLNDIRLHGSFREESVTLHSSVNDSRGGVFICDAEMYGDPEIDADAVLSGKMELHDIDTGFLGNVFSSIQPIGRVNGTFALLGTAAQPQISGKAKLQGRVEMFTQGITLNNPALSLTIDKEKIVIDGKVFSGEGYADINGVLGYGDGRRWGKLKVGGDNFLAVKHPEYSFIVNPDLDFIFDETKGVLRGEVKIISGQIEFESDNRPVTTSDDVVILNKGKEKEPGWAFFADLGLACEDDVTINSYGLSGELAGKLKLKMAPEEPILGQGNMQLKNAKFVVYGRGLDLERGNIVFHGGPIDNPGVDIRVQKTISDEQTLDGGYTVGVDVSGLAQNLQFHLFSDPAMSDTEILSYLLLGHSQSDTDTDDQSLLAAAADKLGVQGDGALLGDLGELLSVDNLYLKGNAHDENISVVVGKRLTRDLYVGYDLNVFSQLGQYWLRYDLRKGFSVQTFSSSESSGADLMYTFEK